jgi:N utilization substance protein B
MQLLFALDRDEKLSYSGAKKTYVENIAACFELFLFNLYVIINITKLSVEDKKKRLSKHLISEEDKAFSAKIFKNKTIQSLEKNEILQKKFKKYDFEAKVDKDFIKKIYSDFSKSEAYKTYVFSETTEKEDQEILLELYRLCRKNDFFNDVMEDNYNVWIDDKSLIVGTVKKILKAYPEADANYFMSFVPDDETIKEFGLPLLQTCHKENKKLLEMIKPVLKNWDHERLAIIDMILMKMALCEMLHFDSIPTKVTLNEYVEIAKLYSTAKSKDFINGVLDNLMKELTDSGAIKKSGRGLEE